MRYADDVRRVSIHGGHAAISWARSALSLLLVGVVGAASPGNCSDTPSEHLQHQPIDLERTDTGERAGKVDKVTTASLLRAGRWLATFPESELRFDAAIGLYHIRALADSQALREAWGRAKAVADRDHDHPMHRLWDPHHPADRAAVQGWQSPATDEPRINVNRVVIEALYCDVHGLREQTLTYLSGPMRDAGGYHTTHAVWSLVMAHARGCIVEDVFLDTARALRRELLAAQPRELVPTVTLDIDLYAERALMLALGGYRGRRLNQFADQLVRQQADDGSWGVAATDEPPYFRYHATMMATWALASCLVAGDAATESPTHDEQESGQR